MKSRDGQPPGSAGRMAKGERPFDADQAKRSADLVTAVSALPWEGSVRGSAGGKAKVKGDPWATDDDFKSLQEGMITEAAKPPAAAGSLATLRAQAGCSGQLGQAVVFLADGPHEILAPHAEPHGDRGAHEHR